MANKVKAEKKAVVKVAPKAESKVSQKTINTEIIHAENKAAALMLQGAECPGITKRLNAILENGAAVRLLKLEKEGKIVSVSEEGCRGPKVTVVIGTGDKAVEVAVAPRLCEPKDPGLRKLWTAAKDDARLAIVKKYAVEVAKK